MTEICRYLLFIAAITAGVFTVSCGAPPSSGRPSASTEPDEPCTVEAPASARQAANNWCQDGIFTKVNVSNDNNNFVALLQFSKKGLRGWERNRSKMVEQFRSLTNEMVDKARMNVAFSLHDTNGQMVGGCARGVRQREASCR